MGALGGRVGAYRDALEQDADLREAIVRNIFRGEKPDDAALNILANRLTAYHAALRDCDTDAIVVGKLPTSRLAV
jgi:cytochrome b pre-mRNA-processing protein 3